MGRRSLSWALLPLLVSFGCKNSDPDPTETPTPTEAPVILDPTPSPTPPPEETPAPTPEPTPAPTPEPTPAPTPEPTPAPTEAPTSVLHTEAPTGGEGSPTSPSNTPAPTEGPTPGPSLAPTEAPTDPEPTPGGTPTQDLDGDGIPDFQDCDDDDASVNPEADERCNDGQDDDCDGAVDDADPDVVGGVVWYVDADADGHGDATQASVTQCERPVGYASAAGDCDDGDPQVHPGALEECSSTVDLNCDGSVGFTDADQDGAAACEECDDTDPAVHPGAAEVCDGVDQDCDGAVDDGVQSVWYEDGDGDGYGDPASTQEACEAPEGYVAVAGDCDDGRANLSPESVWYEDGDGDGYGASSSSVVQCQRPEGYSALGGDCDDTSATFHPGAAEEDCRDPADYNCDGQVAYADEDGDGAPACEDCDDSQAGAAPGGTELCGNGIDDDCQGGDLSCADVDNDADGFTENQGDCDDTLATVGPGKPETCGDGVDQDCSGADLLCQDVDNDGDGFTENQGDCDDAEGGAFPGGTELCGDGIDQDCAGGDLSCTDVDGDGDGYSPEEGDCDDGSSLIGPAAPEVCGDGIDQDCSGADLSCLDVDDDLDSFSESEGDCDDTDPDVHPGATEICGNGIDENCAGGDQSCNNVDNDGDGYNEAQGDCNDEDPAISPGTEEVCGDHIDNDCDEATDEGCTVDRCGTLSSSTTWSAAYVQRVTCDVYVEGGSNPTLKIEAGTRVEFTGNFALYVGTRNYGNLTVVAGDSPAVFTSGRSPRARGDWKGIEIGRYSSASTVSGAIVEYAGAFGDGALRISNASPTVVDTVVQLSSTAGIFASGTSFPRISGSSARNNTRTGINLCSTCGLATTPTPSFTGNTLTGNGEYPLILHPDYVGQLDDSSTFTGNTTDKISVLTGTVTRTALWQDLGLPLLLGGDVKVEGGSSPQLTLSDGIVVHVPTSRGFFVGDNNYGSVKVQGGEVGVVFTSAKATPAPGDWTQFNVGRYDTGSTLTGLSVLYAGGTTTGALVLYRSSPALSGVTVSRSGRHGLYADTSFSRVTGSTFSNNAGSGVYLLSNAGLSRENEPSFSGNTSTGNTAYPIVIHPDYAAQLATDNTLTGNTTDQIYVYGGDVTRTGTWRDVGIPYLLVGDVYVEGGSSPRLSLADGVKLLMSAEKSLYAGYLNYGALTTLGGDKGVTLTSSQASPAPGGWDGVYIGRYDVGSNLKNTSILYAGTSGTGGLHLYRSNPVISGVTVASSSAHGLYGDTAFPRVSGSSFVDNALSGVYLNTASGLDTTSGPTFADNVLSGNGQWPIVLHPNYGAQLATSSTYTGNGTDRVFLHGGTVSTSGTWRALGVPWFLSADVSVEGGSSPRLTLADGAELHIGTDKVLSVGRSNYGGLTSAGSATGVGVALRPAVGNGPGSWGGLYLGRYDVGSSLSYTTLEDGGGQGTGALHLYQSSPSLVGIHILGSSNHGLYADLAFPAISDSTFEANLKAGVHLQSNAGLSRTGEPSFARNTLTGNGTWPLVIHPDYVAQLATSSTYAGNTSDVVYVYGGEVTRSGSWLGIDVPLYAAADVTVQGGSTPRLTLKDGLIVEMAASTRLRVGSSNYGALEVAGADQGVYLTSAAASPAPGDWAGLYVGQYTTALSLTGLTLDYAGRAVPGSVHFYKVGGTMRGCSIYDGSSAGIYAEQGALVDVASSVVSGHATYGVHLATSGGLSRTNSPSFKSNVVEANGSYPVVVHPDYAGELDPSSAFTGNGVDAIFLHGGTVSGSRTWRALDVPYELTDNVVVEGGSSPVLTLSDGLVALVREGVLLSAGNVNYGALKVNGTSDGVLLTSALTEPGPGAWAGVYIGRYDVGSSLTGAVIEYAGGQANGALVISRNNTTVTGCEIYDSAGSGIYVDTTSLPVITQTLVSGSTAWGLRMHDSGGLGGTGASFAGNVLTANALGPVSIPATYGYRLAASSSYDGNGVDRIELRGSYVTTNGTWARLDVPYLISGAVRVEGGSNPILTVGAGATLYFGAGSDLIVGSSNYGGIVADGDSTNRITFTSSAGSPTAGAWRGITLGRYCASGQTTLDNVEVAYGGANAFGDVYIDRCSSAVVSNSTIRDSSTWGIYRSSATPTLTNLTYQNNTSGDLK